MTYEEQKIADADILAAKIKELISQYAPADVDVMRIADKFDGITMLLPPTRTAVMAALVYVATYAVFVDLKESALQGLMNEVRIFAEKLPSTAEVVEEYKKLNQAFHEQQEMDKAMQQGGAMVVPNTSKLMN